MSVRELVVLGTSSQVPTRYRNHNGYLLRFDDEGFLFDPGEGTQRQMIYAEVSATGITRILITHFHGDHCLGFAGLAQRLSLDRVPHPVHVYFPASGMKYFDRLRKASIYHACAELVPNPISEEGTIWTGKKLSLQTMRLDHGVDTWGYRLQEKDGRRMLPDKLEALGIRGRKIAELQQAGALEVDGRVVRVEEVSELRRGQSVAFVMDTRVCDNAVRLAQNADMAIIESTYLSTESREAHDHGHLTAAQAATIAKEAGARQLVLTHFSQRYPSLKAFREEASAIHDNVVLAKDGKRVPVLKRRDSAAEPS